MITYNLPDHIAGDTWDGIPSVTVQLNGSARNLTDALIKMQVRLAIDSPVVLELSTRNSLITILQPVSAGTFSVPSQIIDVPTGKYIYDIKIIFNTGEVKTEIGGSWFIAPHVTR
ncbi:MAG: hypothetical protein EBQ92_00335 [Proteobacteria bacterium]|nr:hypothetical protein [Pseudomonadota bacterium]